MSLFRYLHFSALNRLLSKIFLKDITHKSFIGHPEGVRLFIRLWSLSLHHSSSEGSGAGSFGRMTLLKVASANLQSSPAYTASSIV